jgi:hypothetical protein
MTRFMRGGAAVLLSLSVLLALVGDISAASPPKPAGELVVHEWGTFSTFSGSDGNGLRFHPNDQDLPEFMYRGPWDQKKEGRGAVLVSLETPVVYFYSDREITASVRVDFPEGMVTDWYPQASRPPHRRIDWSKIKVFPRNHDVTLIKDKDGKSRYYAAREVDASPIQVEDKKGKLEHEKFLFYRGVGDVKMPIRVQALGGNNFTVSNQGKEPIPALVFVQIKTGKVSFAKYAHLSEKASIKITPPATPATEAELVECVTKLLIEQGLYEKEARAMVKTWQSAWFAEEGTRVLYLVPGATTEAFLPLNVTPKPESLVRVMVGRHDVMTPEDERALDLHVKQQEEYQQLLGTLGRYQYAAQNAALQRIRKAEEARTKPRE